MATSTTSTAPLSILFIGNSLTYYNGCVSSHVAALAGAAGRPVTVTTCVKGGASLRKMWQKTKAKKLIAEGGFDVVVVQEDLPETTVERFKDFVRKFAGAVDKAGGTMLVFMTWACECNECEG